MSMLEAGPDRSSAVRHRHLSRLSRSFGLRMLNGREMSIRRVKRGSGFGFVGPGGRTITDLATLTRLRSLAVPPAYSDVRYAREPDAHLQAIGRDGAGRLQYRYHPHWEKVRETRKARRLMRLVAVLPRIRRSVAQRLASNQPTRELALSAVIELVARTAIRPGNETYARLHGSRGATTLLKSNISLDGGCIALAFRAKGGKNVRKACDAPGLARAIELLLELPGRRLFQYRKDSGEVCQASSAQVNAFLREIAGVRISLKDFRTLLASGAAMEALSRMTPAGNVRARNRQIMEVVRASAEELANTPAICRRSYVHSAVVAAFEEGTLARLASDLKYRRSRAALERALSQVLASYAQTSVRTSARRLLTKEAGRIS